jgi:ribosomal protein L40E
MNCPKCNALNSGTARFCKACGADCRAPAAVAAAPEPAVTANTLKCLKCGTQNAPMAKFCKGCGAVLASSAGTAETRLAAEPPFIRAATHEPESSTPTAPELAPLTSQVPPSVVAEPMEVVPDPPEPRYVSEPEPEPVPQPTALPSADGKQMGGVACFKCTTLNSPSAKFCKSCGVASPSDKQATARERVNQPGSGNGPQRPWLLWAGAAAAAVVLLGGGAYWMLSGSSPVAVDAPTVPPASSAPEPTSPAAPAPPPVTSPAPVSVPPAAPAPAPGADPQPAQGKVDIAPAAAPEPVASEPAPALNPPQGSSAPSGPTAAEREATARAKLERDAKARQQARDKAMLDKTNRTLDDLLKN